MMKDPELLNGDYRQSSSVKRGLIFFVVFLTVFSSVGILLAVMVAVENRADQADTVQGLDYPLYQVVQ